MHALSSISKKLNPTVLLKEEMKKQLISKQSTLGLFLLAFLPLTIPTDILYSDKNITDGQTLVSPKSIFVLGFFSPGSSSKRYVGIWLTFKPDAVIWVANRDHPLNDTSGTLTLNKNGSIVLRDSSGKIAWSPSTNSSSGTNNFYPVLQLNDSGNLFLKDQTSDSFIWQSFEHPTNTLLAGMKLGKNLRTGFETYLSSWKSSNDPSEGSYTWKMDTEGAPEIVLWDNGQIITRTGLWNGVYFSGIPGMLTYADMINYLFRWDREEVSYEFEAKSSSTLPQIVLEETGVIRRLLSYHQKWYELPYVENGRCNAYAMCGPFSICQRDSFPACNCLKGFQPLRPMEWYMRNSTSGGCKRIKPLGCSASSDGFYPVRGVGLPRSHNATTDASISVKECRSRCLTNCLCMGYAPLDIRGEGHGCVMWNTQLVDTQYVIGGQDLYVKVSKSELGTSNKKQLAATIGIVSSSIIILLISSLLYLLWRKRKRYSKQDTLAGNNSFKSTDLPVFDMDTILQATGNFSITNKLGEGGFGIVYKGQLPCGQEIAVKRLSKDSRQGLNEFMNEVELIAKLQHRNLVRLLGCCIDNNERLLIYEFMTNKSLDFFIFDTTRHGSLNWTTRIEIVVGIARGLLYLHQDSRFNIIHRDLKAANILLDEEMNPKISDFGTARLFRREQGVINTVTIIGTRGYMSPEYVLEGAISTKSDVYSFGVLLLEIISGKKNQGDQSLLAYAWELWEERKPLNLLDEAVESSAFATQITRCVHLGLLCVQEHPDDRPSMSSFFTMLSSDMVLPDPKKPLLGTRIRSFPSDRSLYEYDSSTVAQMTTTEIEGR